MMSKHTAFLPLAAALLVLTWGTQASSQTVTDPALEPAVTTDTGGTETETTTETTVETTGNDFTSREQLITTLNTLTSDEPTEDTTETGDEVVVDPEGDVTPTETDVATETTEETTETTETTEETTETTGDEVVTEETEVPAGGEFDSVVAQMTDEQVFAFNRSLNNAANQGLKLEIDPAMLQVAIDGDYDKRQINSLTKAFEAEAKFTSLADKFADKFAESGNEKQLAKVDFFTAKADREKNKFLGKIDKSIVKGAAKDAAKSAAKGAARAAAKKAAKSAAKQAAKSSAKSAAKSAAKQAAKSAARENSKRRGKKAG